LFIERLKEGLSKKGIKLGIRISIDSTSLLTLKNDECGKNTTHITSRNIISGRW